MKENHSKQNPFELHYLELGWTMPLICFAIVLIALTNWDDSEKIKEHWLAAQKATSREDYKTAQSNLTAILKLDPDLATAYYYRGRVRFQAGDVAGSIVDFDRYIALSPSLKSRQWERGISLYYGKKFKAGAKQFEIYQTYHDNDVENSAWRFLCVAQTEGIEAARKNLLPIKNDRRIPMMQIYEMYKGKLKPADVVKAAEELPASDEQRNSAKFYANLYIGLLYEVEGKKTKSIEHIKKAKSHKIGHYMWDVANIHEKIRTRTKNQPSNDKPIESDSKKQRP